MLAYKLIQTSSSSSVFCSQFSSSYPLTQSPRPSQINTWLMNLSSPQLKKTSSGGKTTSSFGKISNVSDLILNDAAIANAIDIKINKIDWRNFILIVWLTFQNWQNLGLKEILLAAVPGTHIPIWQMQPFTRTRKSRRHIVSTNVTTNYQIVELSAPRQQGCNSDYPRFSFFHNHRVVDRVELPVDWTETRKSSLNMLHIINDLHKQRRTNNDDNRNNLVRVRESSMQKKCVNIRILALIDPHNPLLSLLVLSIVFWLSSSASSAIVRSSYDWWLNFQNSGKVKNLLKTFYR